MSLMILCGVRFLASMFLFHKSIILPIILVLVLCLEHKQHRTSFEQLNVKSSHCVTVPPSPDGCRSLPSTGDSLVTHQVLKPPSMLLLQELGIIDHVVPDKGLCLPDFLLKDYLIVERLKLDNPGNILGLYKAVFEEWLRGIGRQPTWRTLIEILHQCEFKVLADSIGNVVSEAVLDVEPLPYSHSLEFASFVERLKKEYLDRSVVDSPLLRNSIDVTFVNLTFMDHAGNKHFPMKQFLYKLNEFLYKHNLVVITGDPGSGKTTLMRYLAKAWAEGRVLQSCQILLLFYLGEYKSEYKSLNYLLKHTEYDDYGDTEQLAKTIQGNCGEGACFLLDAYDEKLVKQDIFERLINFNHLPHSLRIVTSRPSFANKLKRDSHIKVVGFNEEYVDYYVSQLPEVGQNSLQQLWSKHEGIKQACQSPLYLSLVVYTLSPSPDRALSLSTRTQLYLNVMGSLLAHYQDIHHRWNARSLKDCIHMKPSCIDNMLCCAFNTLQRVGFDMIFREREYFEMEESSLYSSINSLSIVSVHPVSPNEVTYSFAHHTFAEFFAALHLTTMHQDEQLFYITRHHKKETVWKFFFGLLGKYYSENVTTISTFLKRYFVTTSSTLPPTLCNQYCYIDNLVLLSEFEVSIVQELGLTNKKIYEYSGTVVGSSMFVSWSSIHRINDFLHQISYILEIVDVHKLCYRSSVKYIIAIEDWSQKLNRVHLDFIQRHLNFDEFIDPVVLPESTSITTLQFGTLSSVVSLPMHSSRNLSRFCLLPYLDNKSSMCKPLQTQYLNIKSTFLYTVGCFNGDFLRMFASIQELGIQPGVQNTTSSKLSMVLRKPDVLHSLSLSLLHCKDVPGFLDGLTELKHLFIRDSNLNGCTVDLLQRLRRNKQLVSLEILDSEIEVCKLADVLSLECPHLKELRLQHKNLTDSDVFWLSLALQNLTLLNSLSLTSKNMTDASVRMLVDALSTESHRDFRKLHLSYNYIGREADDFLTLARLTGLQSLSVYATKQFENLDEIVKVLESLTQLNHLYWRSRIRVDEAHFKNMIKEMTKLNITRLHV